MLCVVCVMALLAKRPKVCRVAVLWSMVEVRNSQHDPAPVLSDGIVLNPAELAAVICPFKDACAYLLPVLRVSRFIFWFNRHIADWSRFEPATSSVSPGRSNHLSYQSKNRCGVLCLSYHKTHLRPTTTRKSDSLLPRRADSDRHLRTDAPPLVHSLGITPWSVAKQGLRSCVHTS